MIDALLLLATVAAVVVGTGGIYAWLTSAPPTGQRGAVPTIRRSLHARFETRTIFCRFCGNALAVENGYCSTECSDRDGTLQAIA